jgi:hypothetical protein
MVTADSCGVARDVLRTPRSARPDWERLFGFLPAHPSSISACQTTSARKRKFPKVGTCLVAYALKHLMRLSSAGGGTDVSAFLEREGGCVLSGDAVCFEHRSHAKKQTLQAAEKQLLESSQ